MGFAGHVQDAVALVPVVEVVFPPDVQGAVVTGGAYVVVAFGHQLFADALGGGFGVGAAAAFRLFGGLCCLNRLSAVRGWLFGCCGIYRLRFRLLLRHGLKLLFARGVAEGDRQADGGEVAVVVGIAFIPRQYFTFYLKAPGQPALWRGGADAYAGVLAVVFGNQVKPRERPVADGSEGAVEVTRGFFRLAVTNGDFHRAQLFACDYVVGFEVVGFAPEILHASRQGEPFLRDKRRLYFDIR